MATLELGYIGQKIAENHLRKNGFKVVVRNYRAGRYGEIDLIAKEGETLVFVEVKTRSSRVYGVGNEAVNFYKIRALKRAANYFLLTNKIKSLCRFDVVSILCNKGICKELHHFRNCF